MYANTPSQIFEDGKEMGYRKGCHKHCVEAKLNDWKWKNKKEINSNFTFFLSIYLDASIYSVKERELKMGDGISYDKNCDKILLNDWKR